MPDFEQIKDFTRLYAQVVIHQIGHPIFTNRLLLPIYKLVISIYSWDNPMVSREQEQQQQQ